jgi:type I restriction enzyme S subunit
MFQRHIAHIKPDFRRIDTKFLAHMLNSPTIRAVAERVAKGVAQRTVTLGDLKNFEIPLPSLPEQRSIADILEKADAIRRKHRRAAQDGDKLFNSLLARAFSGKLSAADL